MKITGLGGKGYAINNNNLFISTRGYKPYPRLR